MRCFSGGRFRINLVYEDNGVLDVHSNQSQQAQDGEKVECLAQQQQSQYDADKDKRKHQQDDDGFAVGFEQEQQGDEHQEKRQRHVGCQCGIGFGLAFLFAEVFHGISFGNIDFFLHLLPHTVKGGNGIYTPAGVGLRHHNHLAVVVLHVGELVLVVELTDHLLQRGGFARSSEYGQRAQVVNAERVDCVVFQ